MDAAPAGTGAPAHEADALQFEAIGVDRIPEADRTATPRNIAAILVGSALSLGAIIFGWLPITLGLGFWSSVSSLAVGVLVGLALVTPLIVIGSRTATNNSTASGAHFGVRGRLIGSIIGLLITLVYTAIATWTAGDAVVSSLRSLFDTPASDLVLGLGYAGAMVLILVVALFGFHLLARVERWLVVASGALLVVLIVAMAGSMNLSFRGGDYALGSFWKTWALSAVAFGVGGPLSFMLQLGDWTRYVSPQRYGSREVIAVGWLGMAFSAFVMGCVGAAMATAFEDPFAPFVEGVVKAAPDWAAVVVLALGLLGAVGLGATTVYSSGLDLDAILPRLTRFQATLVVGVASVVLVYVGALALDAQDSVTAISVLLVAVGSPWAAIVGIGYILARGAYQLEDLQVFNRGRRGGAYWFTRGWNLRAAIAWAAGAAFGLLAVDTTLYTGPIADIADGVDVSFLGAGLISGSIYLCLRAAFPERPVQAMPAGGLSESGAEG